MTGRMTGKVAFVTGAARGQGRSHAISLAREGADIIAIDVCEHIDPVEYPLATPEDLAETARQVESLGRGIVTYRADIRNPEEVDGAVALGVEIFGRLDAVVANAGVAYVSTWDAVDPKAWQTILDVNLTGTWNTIRAAVPGLINGGGGAIVVTSSVAGLRGLPFLSAYSASKAGLVGLARSLAVELGEHGIRVNTVHPGGTDTPAGRDEGGESKTARLVQEHPQFGALFARLLPVNLLNAGDISNAVVFLASDESRHVTGHALTVDAGTTQY